MNEPQRWCEPTGGASAEVRALLQGAPQIAPSSVQAEAIWGRLALQIGVVPVGPGEVAKAGPGHPPASTAAQPVAGSAGVGTTAVGVLTGKIKLAAVLVAAGVGAGGVYARHVLQRPFETRIERQSTVVMGSPESAPVRAPLVAELPSAHETVIAAEGAREPKAMVAGSFRARRGRERPRETRIATVSPMAIAAVPMSGTAIATAPGPAVVYSPSSRATAVVDGAVRNEQPAAIPAPRTAVAAEGRPAVPTRQVARERAADTGAREEVREWAVEAPSTPAFEEAADQPRYERSSANAHEESVASLELKPTPAEEEPAAISVNLLLEESRCLDRARSALRRGNPDLALRRLDTCAREMKTLAQEREALIIEAQAAKPELRRSAAERARAFMRNYPDSPYRLRIKAIVLDRE